MHRGAGCDNVEHRDIQRRLAVSRINGKCEVNRSVGVVLFKATLEVAREVGGSAERDQHPAAVDGGRRCRRQGQRGAVKARALFEGEPPNSRDGAVQRGPICGRQRRLDRLTGERVDEAIVTDVADTVDQSVSDRLVNDWKALRDRLFIEGPSHEWQREVPGRRSRAVPHHVEDAARRPVRTPGAVRHRPSDLPDEQRVTAGEIEGDPGVMLGITDSHSRQLLAHFGEVEAPQL